MIKCEKSTVSLLDDDILYINVNTDQEFGLYDYRQVQLASLRLVKGNDVFSLIHVGDKTIPNKEAREACTRDIGHGKIKAEAIIIHSLGQRIVARHVLKQKRKLIPIRLFTNEDKAKAWLKKIKEGL
ncbi:DUF7793 family protein [Crocinitomix algicola]|uniref:DUF7793 family protein n=1 Tax=Crocinitomix algicola TaxID=1740263 RepID=UPI00082DB86D|nr:hypothetical protein [Crocinitomix algicola]